MRRKCSRTFSLLLVVIIPVLLLGARTGSANETYSLAGTVGIPNGFASADIVWVDAAAGVLLMADRSNKSVDVVDLNLLPPGGTETTARQFKPAGADAFQGVVIRNGAADNEISGPNGVITVHHSEIWVTDAPPGTITGVSPNQVFTPTGDSTIKVLDLRTGAVKDTIHNGGNHRADEVAVDPRHHIFIVANPADEPFPFITLISTIPDAAGHHPIIKTIVFDGGKGANHGPAIDPENGIEQPTWDPRTGNFFVGIPSFGLGAAAGDGGVVEISTRGDADDMKVQRVFIVPNCTPQGTALGPDDELFLGCNAVGRMVVLNIRTGIQTSITNLKGGCDEVWFDRFSRHFLGACHQGVPSANPKASDGPQVLGSIDSDPIAFDSNVATNPNNTGGRIHALAADDVTGRVFVAAPRAGTPPGNNALCATSTSPNGCLLIYTPGPLDNDDRSDEGRREEGRRDRQ